MSGSSSNTNNPTAAPSPWQPWPDSALSMARTALSLTSQDWSLTGRGPGHPSIPPFLAAAAAATTPSKMTATTNSIVDEVTERMVSLLLIRIVALVTCRLGNLAVQTSTTKSDGTNNNDTTKGGVDGSNINNGHRNHRRASNDSSKTGSSSGGGGYHRRLKDKMYMDYSTSTICRSALKTAREEGERKRKQQQIAATSSNDDVMSMTLHPKILSNSFTTTQVTAKKKEAKEQGDVQQQQDATPMTTLRQYSSEPKSYSITTTATNSLSTSTSKSSSASSTVTTTGLFPKCITPQIIHQLRTYVHTICSQYHSPHKVPYHNVEHAYHVFLSANKLLDLMLCEHTDDREDKLLLTVVETEEEKVDREAPQSSSKVAVSSTPKHTNNNSRPKFRRASLDSLLDLRPTYGIKSDPLTQLAFLFSALVHDVDHTGISNRQLVLESDDLAILYNDQSVAEQRSLAIAFSVLKRGEFNELRKVLFEANTGGAGAGAEGTATGGANAG
eukprot:CAMPEP_0201717852 /NCGR_PEP_ID=MMETSP0593-20130828/3532_1 /ASSEMBLY_ACC=CAM_ASM_000672 /TAXON_ID=267983 /ORGANISM="Skeletonema japonicum, Strain CCMP2506" /LENGTH=499 /DNA_ID=CAMNT_0048208027 /DNA_START=168 /DNA_END=1663 /DNA_ORIENTATION=-